MKPIQQEGDKISSVNYDNFVKGRSGGGNANLDDDWEMINTEPSSK